MALSLCVSGVLGSAATAHAQPEETALEIDGDAGSSEGFQGEASLDVLSADAAQGPEGAAGTDQPGESGHNLTEESDGLVTSRQAESGGNAPSLQPLTDSQRAEVVASSPRSFVGSQYVGCAVFADVPRSHKFFNEIEWMYRAKLTTGVNTSAGLKFLPKTNLTREAMAAFLYRQHGKASWKPSGRSPFEDVAPGHKFYKEILWMYEMGLTNGIRTSSGIEFQPKSSVSREAMAAFFFRQYAKSYKAPLVSRFIDVPKSHKFYKEISWMRDAGISTGVSAGSGKRAYEPQVRLSREALAAFMFRQAGAPKGADNCLKKWADGTFGTFKKQTVSGYGTKVVNIPGSAGIVEATHEGDSNFIVWTLDRNNRSNDLLVNEIGQYSGVVPFGVEDRESARKIQVRADGFWELTFQPVSSASSFKNAGTGDSVMLYGGSAATLNLTHQGSSNFIVTVHGGGFLNWDLLVNEIGYFNGAVAIPSGPAVYVIAADGRWTAKLHR